MLKRFMASRRILLSLLSLLLVLLIQFTYYENSENTFHFDDRFSIVDNTPIHMQQFSLSNLWLAGEGAYHATRPIPSVTFAIDWWRGGGAASTFLQTNLFIHTLNALLVMALLLVLLQRLYPKAPVEIALSAFMASAIWALHPIQVQGVSYIVQRMATLATLFTLLSVLSYFFARTSTVLSRKILWFFLALLSVIFAMLCKEMAWIAPLLILLVEYCLVRDRKAILFKNRLDQAVLFIPFALAAIAAVLVVVGVGELAKYFDSFYTIRDFTMEERLFTQPRVVMFYLSLIFLPLAGRFSLEHDFVLSSSLISPVSTLFSLLVIVVWCVVAIYFWRNPSRRIIAFLMLFLPLTLVVESSFIGLEMVFEHRMYLPLFALVGLLSIVIVYLLQLGMKQKWVTLVLCGLLISILSMSTMQRMTTWKTTEAMLLNSSVHASNNVRSWSNLGRYYIDNGQYDKARSPIERALLLDNEYSSALEAMGAIHLFDGEPVEARLHLVKAYRTNKVGHSWLNNMAWLHLEEVARGIKPRSFLGKALDFSYQARRLAPREPRYIRMSALIHEQLNDCLSAYQAWQDYLYYPLSAEERNVVKSHLSLHYRVQAGRCLLR